MVIIIVDGELMAIPLLGIKRSRSVRPWWRPVAYTAATFSALAALFAPIPALAAPTAPAAPAVPAVPDSGSRPIALGTLAMPGEPAGTAVPTGTGVAATPALRKIEKGRAEIAALGDDLIRVGQDRDLAKQQVTIAEDKASLAENALREAQSTATTAAAAAVREAAAMPPGAAAPGLSGLGDLARLQRGAVQSQQAAARQIENAQFTAQLALDERTLSTQRYADLATRYDRLNTDLTRKQAAQQKLEQAHADELSAAESTEQAADSRLGASYLAGAEAGRGADPHALQALQFALAQRGRPYVWSEEGPNSYDCSGLMYAAYRSVGFALTRVSRDQYLQTDDKVVDRYSLLPGDLLFFSYSNSWRGIHHVAMYAGDGMMVEAPRTGLNVRLTPVRWSRLFQATRVFGSVDGVTEGPALGLPDPEPTGGAQPTPSRSTTPSPTKTGKPSTSPSGKPSTSPSGKPSGTPSTPTKPTPSTSPTPSTKPTPSTVPTPSTSTPSPTGNPSSSPAGTPATTGSPSGAGESTPSSATATRSSAATDRSSPATASTSASKSSAAAPRSASAAAAK